MRINLIGQKFGALTVLNYHGKTKHNNCLWVCSCVCGKTSIVPSNSLRRNLTRSCGCLIGKHISESKVEHGKINTRSYRIWSGMIQRCTNPKASSFQYYGKKGITVCERWRYSFKNFFEDMGEPLPGMSIDRIDNDGNYEPRNCRWATGSQQRMNQKRCIS